MKSEEELAMFVGTKYTVGVSNCTDAILLALSAAGVGPGDEVISVSHPFVATITPASLQEMISRTPLFKPVFNPSAHLHF